MTVNYSTASKGCKEPFNYVQLRFRILRPQKDQLITKDILFYVVLFIKFLPLLKIALDNGSGHFHFHTFDVSTNTKTITVMRVQKRMKLSSSGEGNDLDLAVDKNEMQ